MVSTTDKKCMWKKYKEPVLEQFESEPTKKFCCITQDRLPILPLNIQENIRNRLIDCNQQTAVAKHRYYLYFYISIFKTLY